MLMIQIALGMALGIILAYVLIVKGAAVGKALKMIGVTLLGLVGVGVFLWLISSAVSTAWNSHGPVGVDIHKAVGVIGTIAFVFVYLGSVLLGAYGVLLLARQAFKTKRLSLQAKFEGDQLPVAVLVIVGLINALFVSVASYGLDYLNAGVWISQVNDWSRSNGFSDAGVMTLNAIFCLWAWLSVLALRKLRAYREINDLAAAQRQ